MNDVSQAGGGQPDTPAGAENPNAAAEPKKTDDTAAQPQKSEKTFSPATAAYSDGLKDGQGRLLKKWGYNTLDEVEEALVNTAKLKKENENLQGTLKKPEELPAVKTLQDQLSKLEGQIRERDALLKRHTITEKIESLAARAENPRVARVLFLEEHGVELNEKGEVEVRTLDGLPVYGKGGERLGLQAAFDQWFGAQLGLQKASDKSGSGALGGGDSEGQKKFTPEAIRNMTLAEYQKNKPEIMAQIKAEQQKS